MALAESSVEDIEKHLAMAKMLHIRMKRAHLVVLLAAPLCQESVDEEY